MIKDRNLDLQAYKFYVIMKPDVATNSIVAAEDISGGDVAACTLVRTRLDYPRNLLYTLTDNASDTLEGVFTTVGYDQFGESVTESVSVDYDAAATTAGTQIFAEIVSIAYVDSGNATTSDTADVGVCIEADVASFGLPDKIGAITDVESINFIDAGVTAMEDVDSTAVVVARHCIRPSQTVAAADDYIVRYKSSAYN
ncbi:MAG: hypothetical protein KJ906_02740 [Nanoarchaeota archaeon]|nr:hypothetical protein [Nanoarchaeota archaeon]